MADEEENVEPDGAEEPDEEVQEDELEELEEIDVQPKEPSQFEMEKPIRRESISFPKLERASILLDSDFTHFRKYFDMEIENAEGELRYICNQLLDKNGKRVNPTEMFPPEPTRKERKAALALLLQRPPERVDVPIPEDPKEICDCLMVDDEEYNAPPPPKPKKKKCKK